MIEINTIYNEDCLNTMARMPDDYISLILTSPPYNNLRAYQGFSFDFESIAKELYRVLKPNSILVWIVGDTTKNFCESLTSHKQAIYFVEQCNFNLLDTMIYHKSAVGACGSNYTYWQAFEYMFIFSKGKPKTINKIKDRKNITAGYVHKPNPKMDTLKTRINRNGIVIQDYGYRDNVWTYNVGFASGDDKTPHPAPFPEQLAYDHIYTWSNPYDLVYDCFMGSATTAKMCLLLHRNYIGSEISKDYCAIAERRLAPHKYNDYFILSNIIGAI